MDRLALMTNVLFVVIGLGGLTGLALLVAVFASGAATTIEFWEDLRSSGGKQ